MELRQGRAAIVQGSKSISPGLPCGYPQGQVSVGQQVTEALTPCPAVPTNEHICAADVPT